jgi:hypothetical protein
MNNQESIDLTGRSLGDYMQIAVENLQKEIGLKPSMGQRMLLRRCLQQAFEGLNKNPVLFGSSRSYSLTNETLARFFLYYNIQTSSRSSRADFQRRINETFGEQI